MDAGGSETRVLIIAEYTYIYQASNSIQYTVACLPDKILKLLWSLLFVTFYASAA